MVLARALSVSIEMVDAISISDDDFDLSNHCNQFCHFIYRTNSMEKQQMKSNTLTAVSTYTKVFCDLDDRRDRPLDKVEGNGKPFAMTTKNLCGIFIVHQWSSDPGWIEDVPMLNKFVVQSIKFGIYLCRTWVRSVMCAKCLRENVIGVGASMLTHH